MALTQDDINGLTRAFTHALRDLKMGDPFGGGGMSRESPIIPDNDPDSNRTGRSNLNSEFDKQLTKSQRALKDFTEKQQSYTKGILTGIPIVRTFVATMEKNSERLKDALNGQAEAYKKGALSMEEFSNRVDGNADKIKSTAVAFDYIQKTLNALSKTTKDYNEAVERLKKAEEDSKKSANSEAADRVRKEKEILEELTEARKKYIEDIRDSAGRMGDPKIREEIKEIVEGAEDNTDRIESAIDGLSQYTKGASLGLQSSQQKYIQLQRETNEKMSEGLQDLGKAIVAGIVAGTKQELGMLLVRQARGGSQRGARLAAASRGMSEADFLTVIDQNRYTMKRLAEDGGFSSETTYSESDAFRELQRIGREFGFKGREAAQFMLEYAGNLRRLGIVETNAALKESILGLKTMGKDLGMTQEEAMETLLGYAEDGFLRAYSATGPGQRFGDLEAMRAEVEARMEVARALNIESKVLREIQQRRVNRDFGDVGARIRNVIFSDIARSEFVKSGVITEEENKILRKRDEGVKLTAEEERVATQADLAVRGSIGIEALETVRGGMDSMGRAAMMQNILAQTDYGFQDSARIAEAMEGAGITDPAQITQEFINEALSNLKNVDDPATQMSDTIHKVITALEIFDGAVQSSAGTLITGMLGVVKGMGMALLEGAAMAGGWKLAGKLFQGGKGMVRGGLNMASRAAPLAARAVPYAGAATGAYMIGDTMTSYSGDLSNLSEARRGQVEQTQRLIDRLDIEDPRSLEIAKREGFESVDEYINHLKDTIDTIMEEETSKLDIIKNLAVDAFSFGGLFKMFNTMRNRGNISENDASNIGVPPSISTVRERYSANYSIPELVAADSDLASEVQIRTEELKSQYLREDMNQYLKNNPDASRQEINLFQSAQRIQADMRAGKDANIEYMNKINSALGRDAVTVTRIDAQGNEISPSEVPGGPQSLLPTTENVSNLSDLLYQSQTLANSDTDLTDGNRQRAEDLVEFLKNEDGGNEELKNTILQLLNDILENNKESLQEQRNANSFVKTTEQRKMEIASLEEEINKKVESQFALSQSRLGRVQGAT